jgi:MoaA/NifB/PqqE/SkfB family radical SAM enzyme
MTETLIMQLSITNRCNLRCTHCYEESTVFRDLTEKEFRIIISKVLEVSRRWGKHAVIWLTGGEPLVHPELWKFLDILQNEKDKNTLLSVYILTNGTLLDEEVISRLEPYSVVTDVQVSLDGTCEVIHEAVRGRNTYQKAIDALTLLSQSRLRTHIHMVITKKNMEDALRMPDLAAELGVNVLTMTRLVPQGRGKTMDELMLSPAESHNLFCALSRKQDELEEAGIPLVIPRNRCDWPVLFFDLNGKGSEALKKNGIRCGIGYNYLSVLEDGTVLPCRRLPIPIGNILHQSLGEILDHPLLWQFRRKHKLMKGACRVCPFNNDLWEYCSGGASCISYGCYNDPFMPDPQCPFAHEEGEIL